MAAVLGQLIWETLKKNNSFLVKEFGREFAKFSKESYNTYNLNSFKYFGFVNIKIVTLSTCDN